MHNLRAQLYVLKNKNKITQITNKNVVGTMIVSNDGEQFSSNKTQQNSLGIQIHIKELAIN